MAKRIFNHIGMTLAVLFLALTGGCATAQGEQRSVLAIADNNLGGLIELYGDRGDCPENTFQLISHSPEPEKKALMKGCYILDKEGGVLMTLWEDGDLSVVPLSVLRAPGKSSPKAKRNDT